MDQSSVLWEWMHSIFDRNKKNNPRDLLKGISLGLLTGASPPYFFTLRPWIRASRIRFTGYPTNSLHDGRSKHFEETNPGDFSYEFKVAPGQFMQS